MKSESLFAARARNLMKNGCTEEEARAELAMRYPDDEGVIMIMAIDPPHEPLLSPLPEELAKLVDKIDPDDIVFPMIGSSQPAANQPVDVEKLVLVQPLEIQISIAAALIKSLPAEELAKLMTPAPKAAQPARSPAGSKAPNPSTRAGRARLIFLAAEDRSIKALSDAFVADIGWNRGDSNAYAKQIIAEFAAGKFA